ncbi:MAG: hypothetical protein ACJ79A_13490 [Gemmatimonadaceae bacterium]
MNCIRPLHEIACYGASNNTTTTSHPAHARDDVYLPSDVAARLLPPDGYHDGERIVWDLTALGGDRRSRAH